MCDLVGNPEDRFSQNEAQILMLLNLIPVHGSEILANNNTGHFEKHMASNRHNMIDDMLNQG